MFKDQPMLRDARRNSTHVGLSHRNGAEAANYDSSAVYTG